MRALPLLAATLLLAAGCAAPEPGAGTPTTEEPAPVPPAVEPVAVRDSVDLAQGVSGRSWDAAVGPGLKNGHFTFALRPGDAPVVAGNNVCVGWTVKDAEGRPLGGGSSDGCGNTVSQTVNGGGTTVLLSISGDKMQEGLYRFTLEAEPSLGVVDVDLATVY